MPQEKADKNLHLKVIRDNYEHSCPFGFPIPLGCANAGNLVEDLHPATNQEIAEENFNILKEHNPQEKCFYADKIIKDKEKVICKFPEPQDKIEMTTGSPLYYKPMSGTLMTGLMTFPLGYYNDNSLERNYYYGYYSMESVSSEDIKYIKDEFNKSIEKLAKLNNYGSLVKKNSQ